MRKKQQVLCFVMVVVSLMFISSFSIEEDTDENEVFDELVLQLFKVSGTEAQMKTMLDIIADGFFLEEKERQAFRGLVNVNELCQRMVPIYKKYFNEDEIQEMINFYRSEIGKKCVKLNPTLMKEGAEVGKQYMQEKIEAIKLFSR